MTTYTSKINENDGLYDNRPIIKTNQEFLIRYYYRTIIVNLTIIVNFEAVGGRYILKYKDHQLLRNFD